MFDLEGQTLGRYQIIQKLGKGGMASVYKAYDPRLDRFVAIKVILPVFQQSEEFSKRFEVEAQSLARLKSPHIVQVYDYGEQDKIAYLVMEYVKGGTLKDKITGRIPYQDAFKLLLPVAEALSYAHRHNIIHRDVKPANILLPENDQPMLSDFGIAKMLDRAEGTLTGSGVGIGTPEYMSPEQVQGLKITPSTDIYSLGIVLFELLTGQTPFKGDTPIAVALKQVHQPLPNLQELTPGLPEQVEKIIYKALAKNQCDRYQTMADLIKDMASLAQEERPDDDRTENQEKKKEKIEEEGSRKHRFLLPAVAVIGIGLLVTGGLFLSSRSNSFTNRLPLITTPAVLSQPVDLTPVIATITPQAETEPVSSPLPVKAPVNPTKPIYVPRLVETVEIYAFNNWQDTAIDVNEGDQVRVAYRSGNWRGTENGYWTNGMNCSGSTNSEHWLPGAPGGALLTRVGNNFTDLFCLGKSPVFVSKHKGKLYFNYNDCKDTGCYKDNEGSLVLEVSVSSPANQSNAVTTASPSKPPEIARSGDTWVRPVDRKVMAYIPAGEFWMGSIERDQEAEKDEKPQHTVDLDAYWIDRTEVTNAMFRRFVESTGYAWGGSYVGANLQPVVRVTWVDADAYCQWVGGSLPTEAQWEKAARGTNRRRYAWGDSPADCENAVMQDGGNGCGRNTTWPVGSKPAGASQYDVLDMAGNVWEWVRDWYSESYYQNSPTANPSGPTSGLLRVLRGGSWGNGTWDMRVANRLGHKPDDRADGIGFRCALTPSP